MCRNIMGIYMTTACLSVADRAQVSEYIYWMLRPWTRRKVLDRTHDTLSTYDGAPHKSDDIVTVRGVGNETEYGVSTDESL